MVSHSLLNTGSEEYTVTEISAAKLNRMAIMSTSFVLFLLVALCRFSTAAAAADNTDVSHPKTTPSTYIVHMAKSQMPASFEHHTHWYDSSLKSVSDSAEMLYTYTSAIHGFSTRLTPEQAASLSSQPGVLSVLPELKYELQTTRTPEFQEQMIHHLLERRQCTHTLPHFICSGSRQSNQLPHVFHHIPDADHVLAAWQSMFIPCCFIVCRLASLQSQASSALPECHFLPIGKSGKLVAGVANKHTGLPHSLISQSHTLDEP